jgi:hypothetical protein
VSVNYNGAGNSATITPGTTFFTNGTTLAETLTNTTTAAINVVYTFNVTTPGTSPVCPLATANQTVTVTVQPAPAFADPTNGAPTICSGTQTDITLNTSVTGAQIRLQAVNYGLASGTLAVGALFNDGQKITEILTNTTNNPVTVTYTLEAIVDSCTPSAPRTVNVIVNPNPSFTVTNTTPTRCSGETTNITFALALQ